MPRRPSLRLRIMAAVAVGLTAVMTLLGVSGVQVLQESKQRLLEERLITAHALVERLDDALLTATQHLAALAATPGFRELAAVADPKARWDELAAQEPFASHGIYLLDARGTVVQASGRLGRDRGVSFASVEAVRKVLAGVQLGRTGHAVIVDSRGVVLASTDPEDRFAAAEHPDFVKELRTTSH